MSDNNNFIEQSQNDTRNKYLRILALNTMSESERLEFLKNEKEDRKAFIIALLIIISLLVTLGYFSSDIIWFLLTL